MSTSPERAGYGQTQHLFSPGTQLPLGLVEAATLLSYLTIRDAEDRDIPAAASSRGRKNRDFYLGAVLMGLALHGRDFQADAVNWRKSQGLQVAVRSGISQSRWPVQVYRTSSYGTGMDYPHRSAARLSPGRGGDTGD